MGFLFDSYMASCPSTHTLKQFRTGVTNSFNLYYERLVDVKSTIKVDDESQLIEFFSRYYKLHQKYVLSLFNEIGHDTTKIKTLKDYSEEATLYTSYYYSVEELWNYFNDFEDDEFFAVMVYISQTASTNLTINYLQKSVETELLKNRIVIKETRKSIFIAMAFDKEMNEVREMIIRTVEDKGYKAVVIDEKEHNDLIVPQILEEINNSEFVVADLTLHKNGVYFEAGYARGQGKEVIFTCRADEFAKSHFDVKQINTIRWKDKYELEIKLAKRLQATITNTIKREAVHS